MTRLTLSIAMGRNPRTAPVLDGRVSPEGIDLIPSQIHPSELFWRQLSFGDFDASEMSMASLLALIEREGSPPRDWVPIPVFTSRMFYHCQVRVRVGVDIATPADLAGKRVGVPEYQQTAAVWSRGILQEHFGVKPSDIEWFMEREPELSHQKGTGFKPPAGVRLTHIAPTSSIERMLIAGELDATLMYLTDRNLIDRSRQDLDADGTIRTLFPDPAAEGLRYFEKTGLYPVNHAMVVRRDITERHPWVILNLFRAFGQARDIALEEAVHAVSQFQVPGRMTSAANPSVFAYPYGVRANRPVLETLTRYAHEQGLTSRRIALDEIFDKRTLDM